MESTAGVFRPGFTEPCGEIVFSRVSPDARHPAPDARRGCRIFGLMPLSHVQKAAVRQYTPVVLFVAGDFGGSGFA